MSDNASSKQANSLLQFFDEDILVLLPLHKQASLILLGNRGRHNHVSQSTEHACDLCGTHFDRAFGQSPKLEKHGSTSCRMQSLSEGSQQQNTSACRSGEDRHSRLT